MDADEFAALRAGLQDAHTARMALLEAHTAALREVGAQLKAYNQRGEAAPAELATRARLLIEMCEGEGD